MSEETPKRLSEEDLLILKSYIKIRVVQEVNATLRTLLRTGGLIAIFWIVTRIAGTKTEVSLHWVIDWALSVSGLAEVLGVLFGSGGVYMAWKYRQLRRADIERLSREKKELEDRIFPNKPTSGLKPTGDSPDFI